MRADPASTASEIFDANRARGAVRFDVHLQDGVTRRRQLHEFRLAPGPLSFA